MLLRVKKGCFTDKCDQLVHDKCQIIVEL